MIRKIFAAAAVIIGDAIDDWASRQSREQLLALIREQTQRIQELEDDIDALAAKNLELSNELFEVYGHYEKAIYNRGKDPDPEDPYASVDCSTGCARPRHHGGPCSSDGTPDYLKHTDPPVDPYDPYRATENTCMHCGEEAGPYWCPHCKAT